MVSSNKTYCMLALAVTVPAWPAAAATTTYTVDARHTFPAFEISHLGFSTQRGRFDRTEGKISLDPKAQTGAIHINIAADSIDTGLAELEERLKKEDFFDTARFPTIRYDADKISFAGDKPVRAEGQLTLRGITKPVPLEIHSFHCGMHPIYLKTVCGADATAAIRRSDFGMTAFLPGVGDEVKIVVQVEAFQD